MTDKLQYWIKPLGTLTALGILMFLAPSSPLDPWNLLSPKKITTMIFALSLIQASSAIMAKYLGMRTSALLTGFLGGLISSTATTASLAKQSQAHQSPHSGEILIFLSATGAMLFEGLIVVIAGTTEVHLAPVLVFMGPLLTTFGLIVIQYRKHADHGGASNPSSFQILPILKLTLFIVAILSISKISQAFFGHSGLLVFTALVSLFEIHGSMIANVQLHESNSVSVPFLCSLLTVSIVASYLSKLFLTSTLGSPTLRTQTINMTLIVFCSLAISWAVAVSLPH